MRVGKKKKKKEIIKAIKKESKKVSFSERIDKLLSIRWIPVLIILLLSIIIFHEQIFQPVAFISSEGGPVYGEGGGSLKDFENPFAEGKLWDMYMGGHPSAQEGLHHYTRQIFRSFALMFFKQNKVIILWIVFLTFCAGLFMFLYMRTMGLKNSSALIIGIAYMFAPMFLSLLYTFHYSKMGVLAILPLFFLNIEKGMRNGQFRYFLYLGGCFALAIGTAHLQFAYFAMLGSGLYFIFKLIIGIKNKEKFNLLLRKSLLYGFAILMGLGLSARVIIPPYLHASKHSKRAYTVVEDKKVKGTDLATSSSWAMHPEEIFSYLIPEFGNYKEFYWGRNYFKINSEYFSSIILLLSIISLVFIKKNINILFFMFLFIVSVLFSLGTHTPIFKLCYHIIPGIKSLRGPSMMAILTYFSAMVMAGIAIKYLIEQTKTDEKAYKITYIILGSAGLISILFIVAPQAILSIWKGLFYSDISQQRLEIMNSNVQNISKGSLILLLNISVFFAGIYLYQRKRIGGAVFALILIPLIIIDTWRIDKDFVNTIPLNQIPTAEQKKIEAYEFIKQNDKSIYRVFPDHAVQSSSLFNRFGYEGVYMVTGFLDFTMWRYDNFLRKLTTNGLNLLCTKYLVSVRDFQQNNFEPVYSNNNLKVYLNNKALPFYYVRKNWIVEENENKILTMINSGAVNLFSTAIIEKEPPGEYQSSNLADSAAVVFFNEDKFYSIRGLSEFNFKVSSSSSGFFILSESYHPDWHCYIDGEEVEVYKANYLWKGVFFPAGDHQINFKFIPKSIYISRKIMFSSMALFFIMFLFVTVKDYRYLSNFISRFKK